MSGEKYQDEQPLQLFAQPAQGDRYLGLHRFLGYVQFFRDLVVLVTMHFTKDKYLATPRGKRGNSFLDRIVDLFVGHQLFSVWRLNDGREIEVTPAVVVQDIGYALMFKRIYTRIVYRPEKISLEGGYGIQPLLPFPQMDKNPLNYRMGGFAVVNNPVGIIDQPREILSVDSIKRIRDHTTPGSMGILSIMGCMSQYPWQFLQR